ncbi:hypothetical protein TNCV_943641 [Trichonephila clavipes]|nr:hypothetical protein TNCV_943641 [Trichonephila clavipes]
MITVSRRLHEREVCKTCYLRPTQFYEQERPFNIAQRLKHRSLWVAVLFTDESQFCLTSDSHRTFTWVAVGPDFILIDDNARPREVHLVDEFLESEDTLQLNWASIL